MKLIIKKAKLFLSMTKKEWLKIARDFYHPCDVCKRMRFKKDQIEGEYDDISHDKCPGCWLEEINRLYTPEQINSNPGLAALVQQLTKQKEEMEANREALEATKREFDEKQKAGTLKLKSMPETYKPNATSKILNEIKFLKTANKKFTVKFSKEDWIRIGKLAGIDWAWCSNCHRPYGEVKNNPNKPENKISPTGGLCPECNAKLYGSLFSKEELEQEAREFAEKEAKISPEQRTKREELKKKYLEHIEKHGPESINI